MIVLDTNALITLQTAEKDAPSFCNLINFIKHHKEHHNVSLPMPAISEFMAGDENELRTASLLHPTSPFKALVFDAKSAITSAKIYRDYFNLPKNQRLQEPRQKIKVDIQIIGIAIAHRAKILITHDNGIKNIVRELNLPIQIFDYLEENFMIEISNIIIEENQQIQ